MRLPILFFLLCTLTATAQNTLPPPGSWREHLPYRSTIAVAASEGKIFAATPYSIFSVTIATGEIQRFSTINGLSESGISTLAFDAAHNKLMVAYRNSNIDLLSSNSIANLPGLKRENTTGDKTVYHIFPSAGFSYLSTGLGILVVDVERAEIRDTWRIGAGGSETKVLMTARDNGFFYAATAEGLKKASATANLADYRNWQVIPALAHCKGVVALQDKVIAWQHDSLLLQTPSGWQTIYRSADSIISIQASGDEVAVSQVNGNGNARVVFLQPSGTVSTTLQQPAFIVVPRQALKKNNEYWVADEEKGLSRWTGSNATLYQPNGPGGIATGGMVFRDQDLFVAAGSVDAAGRGMGNKNGFYRFSNNQWTTFSHHEFAQLDSLPDLTTLAADPRDGSLWAGSWGGGLLHAREGASFEVFKQNTGLGSLPGRPGTYIVSGLAFDAANRLWVTNYGTTQFLKLFDNNQWRSFAPPFPLTGNAATQVVVDEADQKWIVAPGNGLLVYHQGASLEQTGDDRWLQYRAGTASGNLPSNNVRSIVLDKEGSMWVGTDDGIALIPCPWEALGNGCPAVLPVVKEGAFSNYLFKGESVNSMAVDGANRKWIATNNGAWLVTASGEEVVLHFTEENSPLPANEVLQVAVSGRTGEVFFATTKGIFSFRGTATEPGTDHNHLLVFPNPVPPGYSGTIAISGLGREAYVKITELNGRLVHQAKALGGQVVWNGRDYNGRKPASGVYLVLVTDENKKERKAGRIVIIN